MSENKANLTSNNADVRLDIPTLIVEQQLAAVVHNETKEEFFINIPLKVKEIETIVIENSHAESVTSFSTTPISTSSDQITFGDIDSLQSDRCCWICTCSEREDVASAVWVQPCKCRGSTKWVHETCLFHWINTKQRGNISMSVSCPQCQHPYQIIYPDTGNFLIFLDQMRAAIADVCVIVSAYLAMITLYWILATFGAITIFQVYGYTEGLTMLTAGDPFVILLGLPIIPLTLLIGQLIRWEDAIIYVIRSPKTAMRKCPILRSVISTTTIDIDVQFDDIHAPNFSDPLFVTFFIFGAASLPTMAWCFGTILFFSIQNSLHQIFLGGLTYILFKGFLKIYVKQNQYSLRKLRRIANYTEPQIVGIQTIGDRVNTMYY